MQSKPSMFPTTIRWNDGDDVDHYKGVEIDSLSLRWFAWSHLAEDGPKTIAVQSIEDFGREGAPVFLPSSVEDQVLEAIAQKTAQSPKTE